MRFIWKIFRF